MSGGGGGVQGVGGKKKINICSFKTEAYSNINTISAARLWQTTNNVSLNGKYSEVMLTKNPKMKKKRN